MSRPAEVLLAALLAACSASSDPGGEDPRAVPRCANPAKGVEGFVLVRTREVPHPEHVGVRLDYRSTDGERLVYLVGIGGEAGEGARDRGAVVLADGTEARLLGGGRIWALAWREAGPCGDVEIVGNGMDRRRFLELMRETGLVPRD